MKRARPVSASPPRLPPYLPTRARQWEDLHVKWLQRLLQELDNDWIVEQEEVYIDRPCLEAILQHAVGITPATELKCWAVATYFGQLCDQYERKGRPLRGHSLTEWQSACATPSRESAHPVDGSLTPVKATPMPSHGPAPVANQATLEIPSEGPELVTTPDNDLFIYWPPHSKFLNGHDWELCRSKAGWLLFSPSSCQAQLVSMVLSLPGEAWP
jgi:hypothetical protein